MGASQVEVRAEQLLHGYSEGHRLLAASTKLPPDEARQLLIHSDVAAGTERQLSSLPLPGLGVWSLTATWAAPEMPRPGSVWSHTLLVLAVDLGKLTSAAPLLNALRRPGGPDDLDGYRGTLSLNDDGIPSPPISAPDEIAEALALALYGWPGENVAVVQSNVAMLQAGLLAFWAQQWPALRADTYFASRRRVGSPSTARIQLAQARGSSHERDVIVLNPGMAQLPNRPPWVAALIEDARWPSELRMFLHEFGPEATGGRRDVPVLVRLHTALSGPPTSTEPIRQLCEAYPKKNQMARLKREALGEWAPAWRDADELLKLQAAMTYHRSVRWRNLHLPERIAVYASVDENAFADLVTKAWSAGDVELRDAVLGAVDSNLSIDGPILAEIVDRDPSLAARLAQNAPAALEDLSVWEGSDEKRVGLLEALAWESSSAIGRAVERGLTSLGNPTLLSAAKNLGLLSEAAFARAIAQQGINAEALACFERLSKSELRDVAQTALADEDWASLLLSIAASREIAATVARQAGPSLADHLWEAELPIRELVAARVLASSIGRRRAIAVRTTFGPVHEALIHERLPPEDWEALDRVLPEGNDWDHAERLRMLLAQVIEDDDLDAREIAAALRGSGQKVDMLIDLLPKKSRARKAAQQAVRDLKRNEVGAP